MAHFKRKKPRRKNGRTEFIRLRDCLCCISINARYTAKRRIRMSDREGRRVFGELDPLHATA